MFKNKCFIEDSNFYVSKPQMKNTNLLESKKFCVLTYRLYSLILFNFVMGGRIIDFKFL